MTTVERFNRAISYLKGKQLIRFNKDVYEKMNINKSTLSQAVQGNPKYLTESFVKSFCQTYEMFSFDWIWKGDGNMLLNWEGDSQEMGKRYETLPELILNKNGNKFQELGSEKFLMYMPLIEIEAQAGFLESYSDVEYFENQEVYHTMFTERVHQGRYVAFRVSGDSMFDGSNNSIEANSIVSCRELDRQHWKSKLRFKDFPYWVIGTVHNPKPIIKQIINHDINKGIITCHSLNSSPEYKDFELYFNDITCLFYVFDIHKSIVTKINYLV